MSEKDMKDIDKLVEKKAVQGASLDASLPLFLVCHDASLTPW